MLFVFAKYEAIKELIIKPLKIIFAIFLLIFVFKCTQSIVDSDKKVTASGANAELTWDYEEIVDKMTGKKTKFAFISSDTQVEFKFPYNGKQRMRLALRKSGTTDVIISITKGQYICPAMEDCLVRVRFDDGKPSVFKVGQPNDHSTTVLFIQNTQRFISQLKKSKKIKIQATFYQEGSVVFEFNTAGLVWN